MVEDVRARSPFELDEVNISGDEDLERRYRVYIPVVEIDGERAFVYEVDGVELERRLAQAQPPDA